MVHLDVSPPSPEGQHSEADAPCHLSLPVILPLTSVNGAATVSQVLPDLAPLIYSSQEMHEAGSVFSPIA